MLISGNTCIQCVTGVLRQVQAFQRKFDGVRSSGFSSKKLEKIQRHKFVGDGWLQTILVRRLNSFCWIRNIF